MARNYEPTAERPGSEGRIQVMAQRAAANLPLTHADDAPEDDNTGILGRVTRNGIIMGTGKTVCSRGRLQLPPKDLPTILLLYRRRAGLSLRRLAEKSGVRFRTIHRIESGQIKNPTAMTICALCAALGLTIQVGEEIVKYSAQH